MPVMIMVIVTVLINALLVIGVILGGWVGFVNGNWGVPNSSIRFVL
jgi:hypothetical protein